MPAVNCCIFRAPAGNREVCQLFHTFHERHRDECVQMQDRQLKINIEKRKHATTDPYCTKFTLSNGILNKYVSNIYFFPSRQIFQLLKHAFVENPPLCDVSTGQKLFWSPESCVPAFFVPFSGKLKLSLFLQEASNRGFSVLELNKKTYIKTRSVKRAQYRTFETPKRCKARGHHVILIFNAAAEYTNTRRQTNTLQWGKMRRLSQSPQTLGAVAQNDRTLNFCLYQGELTSSASQHPVQTGDITSLLFVVRVLPLGRAAVTFAKSGGSAPVVLELMSSHLSLMAKRRATVKGL